MKRSFQILFTIYFAALLLMPCFDRHDPEAAPHTVIVKAAEDGNHADDLCTPFCICSCCITFFVSNTPIGQFISKAPARILFTERSAFKLSSFSLLVWQPPRLG